MSPNNRGFLTMSEKELARLEVIQRVREKRLTQREASSMLGLSLRQVERLCRAYRDEGASGLTSKARGRKSNNHVSADLRALIMHEVHKRYSDFGPTLALEKLQEVHALTVSRETLRKWMTEDELWVPRAQRKKRAYQPRRRRACLGELIQIDGCDHEWFEERAPRCTLLVYVDDATGRLMEIRFVASESAFSYFAATKSYIKRHGKPVAFYSDKATVFRVPNRPNKTLRNGTQFGRAMNELNIEIICANTPQAKGRVERMNLTLQDRLVKELRLRDISSVDEANAFAPEYMEAYNAKFARTPANDHDAHRSCLTSDDLDQIFTWQEKRKISKTLSVHFKAKHYLVEPTKENLELAGHQCNVLEWEDGGIEIQRTCSPCRS